MELNKLALTKGAVNFIVTAGVSSIVRSIITNNVQPENIYQKVTVYSGAIAIGGMVKEATKKYTDAKIDEYVDEYKKLKAKVQDMPTEETPDQLEE